ncbi:Carbon monoxide dehydrogenase subunit G (CoxG) [Nonomuraea coxensis DSM 45129]|uniref:Carbon monoxide dehydrogenase subunit G (CoxG) n=1 Tax=Nonomuraea coxensis DSM 45129 TaxID=1122611 RepID=A0ABX8U9T9_9ACTN|nr:carbon monoxide dehydrogenase subunit G [Nonomuraea coxensis]QYC43498.1 Carbon monoxide dehydrogenase subunit G (CoxG) [Nonomuraea coxensis DSM 45129]
MRVAGSAVIGVQKDQLWAALQDPAVLVRTIPGCERLEETGPGAYRMTVNAGVASIKGVYQGEVVLTEPVPCEGFTLKARGQGAPGTVEATVQLRLSEADGAGGAGGTRVDYDAEAVIGGMIGGVGQRMLGSVAKRTAGEFFSAVEQHLCADSASAEPPVLAEAVATGTAAGPVQGAGAVQGAWPIQGAGPVQEGLAAQGAGAVYERPPKPDTRTSTRPWVMLASFGAGAGVALAGVAVGWLLARTGRRPRA